MANQKITELTEDTSLALTDLLAVVEDPSGTPATKKTTLSTLQKILLADGWISAGETWTYGSASDPEFTFTIAGVDLTTKYYAGMRIKLTQTTAKYFIITKVAFSTDTTVTIYGGTDYDLANAAITSPYYSTAKAPAGFPLAPNYWTVSTTSTAEASQATPTASVWYNAGTLTIVIPTGSWYVTYQGTLGAYDSASVSQIIVKSTFSTANNSESDAMMTAMTRINVGAFAGIQLETSVSKTQVFTPSSATTYYLNVLSVQSGMDSVGWNIGAQGTGTTIRAVSAYV